MKPNQVKIPIDIKLEDTTEIFCEKCGCNVFIPGVMLRKISKLLVGADQDQLLPLQIFSCGICSHVNQQFLPKELQK